MKYVTVFATLIAEAGLCCSFFSHSDPCGRMNIFEIFDHISCCDVCFVINN